MPSEGGEAVQVTKGSGHYAVESCDGEMLYYIKPGKLGYNAGPIWKVPREVGEETMVLDRQIEFGNWALRPAGIYFATYNGKRYSLEFFSFESGKVAPFYQKETPDALDWLAISPDGEWFVYSDEPPRESDLMLVENFR